VFEIRITLLEILWGCFRRDIEARHDAWVHRNEIQLSHICMQADQRLVDQPALVGSEQLEGGLGPFGLLLVVWHQHTQRRAVTICMAEMPVPGETRAAVCTGRAVTRAISSTPSSP